MRDDVRARFLPVRLNGGGVGAFFLVLRCVLLSISVFIFFSFVRPDVPEFSESLKRQQPE